MSASEYTSTIQKPTEYLKENSLEPNGSDAMTLKLMKQVESLTATIDSQAKTIAELTRELDWFRRNMFGKRSETAKRFEDYEDPEIHQLSLFDSMSKEQKLMLGIEDEQPAEKITIDSYKRTKS